MRRPPPLATLPSPSVLDSTPERLWQGILHTLGVPNEDDPPTDPDVMDLVGIPMMAVGGKVAKAGAGVARRALAKAGSRIPRGSQSSMSVENKIPRFRSPLGTFVKHEGQWWRLGKQPADALNIELELLPSGDELAALLEQGIDSPPVLARKTIRADSLMPKPKK